MVEQMSTHIFAFAVFTVDLGKSGISVFCFTLQTMAVAPDPMRLGHWDDVLYLG